MTRLLQAMAGARHGGAEAFFMRLAMGLARAGETQHVLIRRHAERAGLLRQAGIPTEELRFGGFFDLATGPAFRRVIARIHPVVVLTWMSRATSLCPTGDFVHVARLGGYYDVKYYRRCDHLIGNTPDICAYLERQGWPKERVHYLPNFAATAKAAPVSRASLATPQDAPLALALGRLHPNKGFDVLIEAVARLPRVHLWLAGEGDLGPALAQRASGLGIADRVHFLGWRDDVPALLAAADLLVCSSRHEPLGNTIIEAWAAGVPVVAAASEGPRQLVAEGETGLLVPVEDADALSRAISRVVTDASLRADLGAAGRARYEAEFAEARVVGLYRDFLSEVAH